MKSPQECAHMLDIRTEIDAIDKEIIGLIGRRAGYVKAASAFKTSETAVRAPERFAAMLTVRRQWATEQGLSPDVIEKMYTDLVQYFIAEEMKHWKQG